MAVRTDGPEGPDGGTAPPGIVRRLFVNREVGLLFSGQVVSQAGDSIYQIALLWMVLELTGSKALTGLAAERWRTPYIFLGIGLLAAASAIPGFFSQAIAGRRTLGSRDF
jgi:hypothetical protein